jgi:hypothetical protein
MSFRAWARYVLILFCRRKPRKLTEGEVGSSICKDDVPGEITRPDMAESMAQNGQALGTYSTSNNTQTEQDQLQTVEASDNNVTNANEMTKPKVSPHVKTQTCCVCVETVTGEANIKSRFPYTCHHCKQANYCVNCIKNWFLDACRNESKMPPKCCYAIPLGTVTHLLTPREVSTTSPFSAISMLDVNAG